MDNTRIRIEMDDAQVILARRNLQKNGQAQVKFTQLCAREMNNFVPFDTGRLKDVMVELRTNQVIYNAPYARVQFYSNKGNGKQGMNHGGQRGKRWDIRMWNVKGSIVLRKLADFCGVRSES